MSKKYPHPDTMDHIIFNQFLMDELELDEWQLPDWFPSVQVYAGEFDTYWRFFLRGQLYGENLC